MVKANDASAVATKEGRGRLSKRKSWHIQRWVYPDNAIKKEKKNTLQGNHNVICSIPKQTFHSIKLQKNSNQLHGYLHLNPLHRWTQGRPWKTTCSSKQHPSPKYNQISDCCATKIQTHNPMCVHIEFIVLFHVYILNTGNK